MTNELADAKCAGAPDPDLWFEDEDQLRINKAKSICRATCPVRWECLDRALANPDLAAYGIWGGFTAPERARMTRIRTRRDAA